MVKLRDKFFGCIAGAWAGSAMGAAVEGWSFQKIEKTYGHLERLLPYEHYHNGWLRPPGTTEDGIERQKLMLTAIIEKGDRINAADLVAIWNRDLDPRKLVFKQEPFDLALCELAKAGCPHTMLGSMWPYPNIISVARASHPLGLINAGDPESAVADVYDIGRLYAYDNVPALCWAGIYLAGIAAACAPDATIDSVLKTIKSYITYRGKAAGLYGRYDSIEREVDRAVEMGQRHRDYGALREEFYQYYYGGQYIVYSVSQANEIVSKGIALFVFTKADPKQAIIDAVNCGRDTDCAAAIAGGLAGALSGGASLPPDWISQVNAATLKDPYTNNQRTIEESVDGLHRAYLSRHSKLRQYLDTMAKAP